MRCSLFVAGYEILRKRAQVRQTQAFAPGTAANHTSHLRLFLSFTAFFDLQPFPASLPTLLTFVEFLAGAYSSPKAVTNVLASVRFFHERGGHAFDNFRHVQLRLATRSLPFTMRTHVRRAPPFPFPLLQPLSEAGAFFGPWALAFRALILFAFFTFARLGSLVPVGARGFDHSRFPTVGDLCLSGTGASLWIKYSKTRQGADGGFWVPLEGSVDGPCPVRCAKELLVRARGKNLPSATPLFAAFLPSHAGGLSLSQSQARGFLAKALGFLGLPPNAFSFHSFRRGGCSLAFERGASEGDLALHGDWRSAAIRAYYPAASTRGRVAALLAAPNTSPTP